MMGALLFLGAMEIAHGAYRLEPQYESLYEFAPPGSSPSLFDDHGGHMVAADETPVVTMTPTYAAVHNPDLIVNAGNYATPWTVGTVICRPGGMGLAGDTLMNTNQFLGEMVPTPN